MARSNASDKEEQFHNLVLTWCPLLFGGGELQPWAAKNTADTYITLEQKVNTEGPVHGLRHVVGREGCR